MCSGRMVDHGSHRVIIEGQQHISQWVVQYSGEGTKGMDRFDHVQHKMHLQDTDNGRAVPQRADYKRN